MAVALATKVNASWAGYGASDSYTITFPSGLAVGELLLACVFAVEVDSSPTPAYASPAGWTQVGSGGVSGVASSLKLFARVATSGDVSAGSVTSSCNLGGSDDMWLSTSCLRITGAGDISSIQTANEGSTSQSPSYAIGLTPTFADSLILFYVAAGGSQNSTSISGYAMATDNPSWTEQFDVFGDSAPYAGAGETDGLLALASATRAAVTSTGNLSASVSLPMNNLGVLAIIPPVASATATPGTIDLTSNVQAPSVTGGAVATPSAIELVASVASNTVTADTSKWSHPNKSSTAWTNTDKS